MSRLAHVFSDQAWLWVRVLDSADCVGDIVEALQFCRVPMYKGLPLVLKQDWDVLLTPAILTNFSEVWVFDHTSPSDVAQELGKVDLLTTDNGQPDTASSAATQAALKQLGALIVLADGACGMNFVTVEPKLADLVKHCESV